MRDRSGGWIQTYTGRQFWPLDARPEDVDVRDIAHALAHLCRFTGHVRHFYSVAQHSVLVSQAVPDRLALAGLLHDAAEAYLGDASRPLKRHLMVAVGGGLAGLREWENRLQLAIDMALGVPPLNLEDAQRIKAADTQLLVTEARDLMGPLHPDWQHTPDRHQALSVRITPLGPIEAERLFLRRFQQLGGEVPS